MNEDTRTIVLIICAIYLVSMFYVWGVYYPQEKVKFETLCNDAFLIPNSPKGVVCWTDNKLTGIDFTFDKNGKIPLSEVIIKSVFSPLLLLANLWRMLTTIRI